MTPDIAARREPVHQLHRTVMSNLQPLGDVSDPRAYRLWQPFQGKHKLMLVRLKASHAGSLLTEMKESAYLITQFCEGFVVSQGKGPFHRQKYIVSRPFVRLLLDFKSCENLCPRCVLVPSVPVFSLFVQSDAGGTRLEWQGASGRLSSTEVRAIHVSNQRSIMN